ncbi:MAG TPA: dienelactone hydrolase family protein [Polyangiaceae bacterium]|jgi:carboxymethylenebutenolidase|nr:dienelactone hydrolase family protein [Polyangiaceae bacterium]
MTQRIESVKDVPASVWRLFDEYVHGLITRREFVDGASKFVVGGLSGAALLEALQPRFAEAAQVPASDAHISAEFVEFPSAGYGKARAYRVKPKHPTTGLPLVLVVHENRGLNPHIEDIARRLALDGFIALAPDALFPLGGYPGDEDKARELFTHLDQTKTRADFVSAARALLNSPDGNGQLGVVGFCWGGGITNSLATTLPELRAAVPFYGMAPELSQVPKIKAKLLLHFAENDERINASWPPYQAALDQAKVSYEAFTYAGTQHGFNNDTTPRYDKAAAKLAWERTLALFHKELPSPVTHGHH